MRAKDGFSERSDIYTWKNEAVNRNENAFFYSNVPCGQDSTVYDMASDPEAFGEAPLELALRYINTRGNKQFIEITYCT